MSSSRKKWNLIIDVAKCENCNNCFLSCKDEHVDNDFPGYAKPQPRLGHSWIEMHRTERGQAPMVEAAFYPGMCNHCDNAPCIDASDGAIYKRADGIVIIDPEKSKGRKDLVDSCPYGSIHWNEEEQVPQKWIFDAHLLDQGWKQPRCAQSCPTGAIWGLKTTDADMATKKESEGLQVLKPELNTQPRVYYKNMHLFNSLFIGGTIEAEINGVLECLEGATIDLYSDKNLLGHARSDNYGDFKIDNIDPSIKKASLIINHPEYKNLETDIEFIKSRYLGVLRLQK